MQSGCEFHLDGPIAAEIRSALRSALAQRSEKAAPIFVTPGDEQQAEFMLVPKYVESYRWYPHGTIDTTLGRSISDLGLTTRTKSCLATEDIDTIGKLVKTTEEKLLHTPNLGPKSITEIKAALANYGLELSE